jgi:rare lipoprotein A
LVDEQPVLIDFESSVFDRQMYRGSNNGSVIKRDVSGRSISSRLHRFTFTYAMTAAHKTRRFGSHVTVTNLVNGRFTTVRINDRGPFVRGRCIDLSRAAADAIGMGGTARAPVQ